MAVFIVLNTTLAQPTTRTNLGGHEIKLNGKNGVNKHGD